jgi:hypothetical protein
MIMLQHAVHPSVEELTAFSVRQLSSAKAETVESHIGECTPCCGTLMGLATDDTFVGLLKEAGDPASDLTTMDGLGRAALAQHPRYEILEQIAKGRMGEVFRARHRMMDRTVALTFINRDLMRNPDAVERFHREVKTAAHLSHPNIVTAYDAEQAEGLHFLVMEHVAGVNLAELVKKNGPLSISDSC